MHASRRFLSVPVLFTLFARFHKVVARKSCVSTAFISRSRSRPQPTHRLQQLLGFPRSNCCKYSTDDVEKLNRVLTETLDESLLGSYQTVAKQDPTWYNNYVVNVLGKSLVAQICLPPIQQVNTKRGDFKPEPTMDSRANSYNQSVKSRHQNSASNSLKSNEYTCNETSTFSTNTKKVRTSSTMASLNDKSSQDGYLPWTNNNGMAADSPKSSEESSVTAHSEASSMDGKIFVYQDPETGSTRCIPLSNLTGLGYTEDELLVLQPDVLNLIINDNVRKPRAGIPSLWETPTEMVSSDVQMLDHSKAKMLTKNDEDGANKSNETTEIRATGKAETEKEALDPSRESVGTSMKATVGKELPHLKLEELSSAQSTVKNVTLNTSKKGQQINSTSRASDLKIANDSVNVAHHPSNPAEATLFQEQITSSSQNSSHEGLAENFMVSYLDSGTEVIVPLSKLTSLGYAADDVELLQPDVIGLILVDSVQKPRNGVPAQWQSTRKGEVQLIQTSTKGSDQIGANKSAENHFRFSKGAKILGEDFIETEKRKIETVASGSPTKQNALNKQDGFGERLNAPNRGGISKSSDKNATASSATQGRPASPGSSSEESEESSGDNIETSQIPSDQSRKIADTNAEVEYMVVYVDSAGRRHMIPLANVSLLGYSRDEILDLQCEVLAMIVSDSIRKPRAGVPSSWRVSRSNGRFSAVKVLPRPEAEALLQTEEPREVARGASCGSREDLPGLYNRESAGRTVPPQENRREKVGKGRNHEKSVLNPDGTKKSIYNGRRINQKKRVRKDDPPAPKSPFWMDIDTFRDLLRSEAELRIRILGEDFAPAIKEESDWRLGLYKDWLWTLEKGIGNPIVPSRGERRRTSTIRQTEGLGSHGERQPRRRSTRRRDVAGSIDSGRPRSKREARKGSRRRRD